MSQVLDLQPTGGHGLLLIIFLILVPTSTKPAGEDIRLQLNYY